MEENNKVSLWIGNFTSKESFEEFKKEKYTWDGDLILSHFQRLSEVEEYNEDFAECEYFHEYFNCFKKLLDGASYYDQIIPKFEEMYKFDKDKEYNSIILLYNFRYHEKIKRICFEDSELEYVGSVEYDI